jgi:ATP-dependent Zn protease
MRNVDDRYLTACHEAGHAVAALMRGGGEVTSISIEPTADHLGITQHLTQDVR